MVENLNRGLEVNDQGKVFILEEYLGSGSYGEVWLATNKNTGEEVAIKFYIALDRAGREEFMREYEIASGLNHPKLLTAQQYGIWKDRPYLVMKYCAKGASAKLVGTLNPSLENEKRIWKFIQDVSSGLAYLHSQMPDPIVHQDIKPDNILMDDEGGFLITDFGISKKIRTSLSRASKNNLSAGAVPYMGPERFSKNPAPIMASDIWSLGVSIYELAMGDLPFSGQGGAMQNFGAEMPELENGWSPELNKIMQQCLAKAPWDRLKAFEIKEVSKRWLENGDTPISPTLPPTPTPSPIPSPSPLKKVLLAIGAICLIGLVVFFGFSYIDKKSAKDNLPEYERLVSECQTHIERGNDAEVSSLLAAKSELKDLKSLQELYANKLPERYNRAENLENQLTEKLISAGAAWGRAAKSQYENVKDLSKAIEYYQLSLQLYEDFDVRRAFENIVKEVGYMNVKDIEFRNEGGESEVIDDYGSSLTASKMRYLHARILYDGVFTTQKDIVLKVKIKRPDGTLKRGTSSPEGYTFEDDDCTVIPGENNYLYLIGWGNAEQSTYSSGTYIYEVWYLNNMIFSKNVRLN